MTPDGLGTPLTVHQRAMLESDVWPMFTSLQRGIADAEAGRIFSRGSFARYAKPWWRRLFYRRRH